MSDSQFDRLEMRGVRRHRKNQWIVCQLGARENYMVGRALASMGKLGALITDAWQEPGSLPARYIGRLRDRYHPQLAAERIEAPGYKGISYEVYERILGVGGWRSIMNRNLRFGEMAATHLRTLVNSGVPCDTVFAYSYAAGPIFGTAQSLGLRTVLGQIDPGPIEDELVAGLYERAGPSRHYERIPPTYWECWREEIALSDIVVANSDWSKNALIRVGVPEGKITVLPLAYDVARNNPAAVRSPPASFTHDRPLRLLFLGQVTLRKGIGQVLDAMQRMINAPIRLDIVGEVQIGIPASTKGDSRIVMHGPVKRSSVASYYRNADLFLFPTLSDGFGLTQLEALAHRLPVLASRNCGQVIEHDVNGFVLDRVTSEAIERVLREVLDKPARLQAWSERAMIPSGFSQEDLAANLSRLMSP